MKKLLIVLAVVLFSAGFASKVSAQAKLTDNTAGGEILSPISLVRSTQLQFGKLAVIAPGGTVVLSPSAPATLIPSGGVTVVTGVIQTAASFIVSGATGYGYAITAPSTITVVNGAASMVITPITVKTGAGLGLVGTLTGGTDNFYIGGTLTVSGTQLVGTYSALFDVTVNYN